jgi:hypothetical protein
MTAKLKLIKTTHRAVVDIYGPWRAEIAERDWKACHTKGDRNPPLEIADRPKRGWRA